MAWAAGCARGMGRAVVVRALAIAVPPRPRHFLPAVVAGAGGCIFAVTLTAGRCGSAGADWWYMAPRSHEAGRIRGASSPSRRWCGSRSFSTAALAANLGRPAAGHRRSVLRRLRAVREPGRVRARTSNGAQRRERAFDAASARRAGQQSEDGAGDADRDREQPACRTERGRQHIDRDEDVVMLFLTSHGSRTTGSPSSSCRCGSIRVERSDLKAMLDDAGIRWRIVVVSACYCRWLHPRARRRADARHDRRGRATGRRSAARTTAR